MKFVSIIYTQKPEKTSIPFSVFEDIKLTELLSKNVLGVMQYFPNNRDISLRHEMFCFFLENGTQELKKLSDELKGLKVLFETYQHPFSDSHRQYVFAALLHRVLLFYAHASQSFCDTEFMKAFSASFKALYDKNISFEAQQMYEKLCREVNVELKEGTLVFKKQTTEGYAQRLCCCAKEMGVELNTELYAPKTISGDFIESISKLYPELWKELSLLEERYKTIPDEALLDYIDQFEYYIENVDLAKRYTANGIPLSYAEISDSPKIRLKECYDITLMSKLCNEIIPNDVRFDTKEPLFFLSGANGGGKTTYLRTCGVAVIMSLCGCPVPALSARLCRLDTLQTHFPKDERFDLEGRFADEERRVEDILSVMGERSLILLNETYSTTNEQKAKEMTCKLANELKAKGQFGIYVTHQKASDMTDIPMLCCVVDTDNANKRTYKIERTDLSVTSRAVDVLKKYSLSRADLEERFGI